MIFKKKAGPLMYTGKARFSHGGRAVDVRFSVPAAETMAALRGCEKRLKEKERELNGSPGDEKAQQDFGAAVLDTFAAVLGREGVVKAFSVYGNDYGSFVKDAREFLFGTAVPKMKRMEARERKAGRSGTGWGWNIG